MYRYEESERVSEGGREEKKSEQRRTKWCDKKNNGAGLYGATADDLRLGNGTVPLLLLPRYGESNLSNLCRGARSRSSLETFTSSPNPIVVGKSHLQSFDDVGPRRASSLLTRLPGKATTISSTVVLPDQSLAPLFISL